MSLVVPRKACRMVALVLVCLAVGATMACQIHLVPFDHEHGMPDTHQTGSAAHSGLDFSCVVAVLPVMIVLLSWFSVAFHVAPRVLKHTVPVLPPFIPPRYPAHF